MRGLSDRLPLPAVEQSSGALVMPKVEYFSGHENKAKIFRDPKDERRIEAMWRSFVGDGVPEDLTAAFLCVDLSFLEPWFKDLGLRLPTVDWLEGPSELDSPFGDLARWYFDLGGDLPDASLIDPVDLRAHLGHLMILDVLEGGVDFRYRVYGSDLANRAGFDLTGKRLSDLADIRPLAGILFRLSYTALIRKARPFHMRHDQGEIGKTTIWRRLALPFSVAVPGQVGRIMVLNIPTDQR